MNRKIKCGAISNIIESIRHIVIVIEYHIVIAIEKPSLTFSSL